MTKSTKPVWILCPRCELNYIKKADQYCNVCKKEMKLIEASEDDIGDLELCPVCKINFVQNNEEVCDSCKQELGMNLSEDEEDKEISDWHKYIDDDDNEDEDEESNDEVYERDDLEDTAGIVDDFGFDEDMAQDLGVDDDDDDDLELDMIDDDDDDDDDFEEDDESLNDDDDEF